MAVDQVTTSTRCIVFERPGRPVARGQREHWQHFRGAGWGGARPGEIWRNTRTVVMAALGNAGPSPADVAA